MILSRRRVLLGLLAAPIVVRSGVLMPVHEIVCSSAKFYGLASHRWQPGVVYEIGDIVNFPAGHFGENDERYRTLRCIAVMPGILGRDGLPLQSFSTNLGDKVPA